MTPNAAFNSGNQSDPPAATVKEEEPIGYRWEDEEDWGSLEVRTEVQVDPDSLVTLESDIQVPEACPSKAMIPPASCLSLSN